MGDSETRNMESSSQTKNKLCDMRILLGFIYSNNRTVKGEYGVNISVHKMHPQIYYSTWIDCRMEEA
jgi:hypothetical protein